MHTIEDIELKLEKCEKYLEDYEKQSRDKKTELELFYKQTYSERTIYNSDGKELKCIQDGFQDTYQSACTYIKKQLEFIKQIKILIPTIL